MIARLRLWWIGLGRRERALIAGAAVFALLALLYLLAIEPAWNARARLASELPRLRAQAAEVESLAQEAKRLKGRSIAADSASATKNALEQSIARANLVGVKVTVVDDRRLTVSAKDVPVTQWLAWAEEAARESRLRIGAVRISHTSIRAVVDAEAAFEVAGRQ